MGGIITYRVGVINDRRLWYHAFMRKMIAGLCLLVCGFTGQAAHADYDEGFNTGKDWVHHMSQREKFMSLLPPTMLFDEYDIHLRHSLPEYIVLLDHILLRNPQLENEEMTNVFASAVYLFEPQNREALKTLEIDLLRGDPEDKTTHPPKLTIEELLKEVTPDPQSEV